MLTLDQINGVVRDAISNAGMPQRIVADVKVAEAIDYYGDEDLNIRIVLKDGGEGELTSDRTGRILTQVLDTLSTAGDHRFPVFYYATETEMVGIHEGEH